MHCENKRLLNACMTENGMCVLAEGKLWMLEWLIPCPRMDMNELMCLLGKGMKNMKVSLMELELSCQLGNWLTDFNVYIMLVWQNFNGAFHRWEKWNLVVHIDHGSRSKVAGIWWKSPSNDCQDPRKYWGDAQDTKKAEWNEPPDFARLYWFAKGGEKPSGSNRQRKGRWISNGTFVQVTGTFVQATR